MYANHFLSLASINSIALIEVTTIIPILKMRKLRLRKMERLVHGCNVGYGQREKANAVLHDSEAEALKRSVLCPLRGRKQDFCKVQSCLLNL